LIFSIFYLLSPATIEFENELFYTPFVSILLLLSLFFLLRFKEKKSWANCIFIFFPLTILCYSRSIYHITWLTIITFTILYHYRKKLGFVKLASCGLASIILVFALYLKNYLVFDSFSSSSWL